MTGVTINSGLNDVSISNGNIAVTLTSGVSDHGSLSGLADDDHSQYHNDARGDLRYYQKSEVDTALSGKSDTSHNHNTAYYTKAEVDAAIAAGGGGGGGANIVERQYNKIVSNTTSYTPIVSYTLPADTMSAGSTLEITMKGHFRNRSGSSGNFIFDMSWDSGLVFRSDCQSMSSDISDDYAFEFKLTIEAMNSTDFVFISGHFQINLNDDDVYGKGNLDDDEAKSNVILQGFGNFGNETDTAADLTTDQDIVFQCKPSIAHDDMKMFIKKVYFEVK
jgi:hypothetical protein